MNWKNTNVLITGGAGFIGSNLADRCLAEGAHVRILDNFITGDRSNISTSDIEIIEGDVRDMNAVEKAMKGIDIVFHQAAQLNPAKAVRDPFYDFDVNVRGGINVMFSGVKHGVRKIILASTNVYARGQMENMKENVPSLFLKETLLSPYAAAKVSAEAYAKVVNDEFKVPTVRLRYSNVIGPRQRTKTESGVVALFVQWAFEGKPFTIYGNGEQKRDFVYVDDVVNANMLAASNERSNGDVFNIGVGQETSLNELAKKIMQLTGRHVEIHYLPERAADYPSARIDLTHSCEVLGYMPQTDVDEGLRRFVNWYKEFNKLQLNS